MADKLKKFRDDSSTNSSDTDVIKSDPDDKADSNIPSIPPIDNRDDDDEASDAIERFLEQVAASANNSQFKEDNVRTKDKDVKRASRMIIPPECKCHLNNGKPCHTRFSVAELMDTRMHYMTISKKELDIAVLAKLECGIHLSRMTTRKKRKPTERKKHRTDFYHRGYRICNLIFVYLHGFSYKKLKALIIQYKTNGVRIRIHKNLKPKSADEENVAKKKKSNVKPRPKLKDPKEKKVKAKKERDRTRNTGQSQSSSFPSLQFSSNIPQAKVLPQRPHLSHVSPFPCSVNQMHPAAAPFSMEVKHNISPNFSHSTNYNPPAVFTHYHAMTPHPHHPNHPSASSHSNPSLDYSSQIVMANPTLDFSNQLSNPNGLTTFPGQNYASILHTANF